jgi:hypothetical protein
MAPIVILTSNLRKCTSCQIEKDISEFGIKNRKYPNGTIKVVLSIYCRECEKLKAKQWRANHPEQTAAYNAREDVKIKKKEWEEINASYEDRKEYFQQYYENNIETFKDRSQTTQFKETKRKYKKNKRNIDPIFRVRENISNAILKALKKGKSDKAGQSIMQFLGYTITDLSDHLEKQFNDKMTWDNYGIYWHIDHIIPQSDLSFKSMKDENFNKCWSLNNLRPLEAKQNIKDGATRIRHKKV